MRGGGEGQEEESRTLLCVQPYSEWMVAEVKQNRF